MMPLPYLRISKWQGQLDMTWHGTVRGRGQSRWCGGHRPPQKTANSIPDYAPGSVTSAVDVAKRLPHATKLHERAQTQTQHFTEHLALEFLEA